MYLVERLRLGEQPAAASRCTNSLDATARTIIAAAQDPTLGIYGRAVRAFWSILRTYYPTEATKVAAVVFSESINGLQTTRAGTGPAATGIVTVGKDFIDHTNDEFFARRVLQVGHELQHIDRIPRRSDRSREQSEARISRALLDGAGAREAGYRLREQSDPGRDHRLCAGQLPLHERHRPRPLCRARTAFVGASRSIATAHTLAAVCGNAVLPATQLLNPKDFHAYLRLRRSR